MLASLINALKAVIFTILNLFVKCFNCIFRRGNGRKTKLYENDCDYQLLDSVVATNPSNQCDNESWEPWNNDALLSSSGSKSKNDFTINDHITAYREALQKKRQSSTSETSALQESTVENMFAELAPTSIKQKKVYIGPKDNETKNRLSVSETAANVDPILYRSEKLEDWNDTEMEGWEATDEEDIKKIIREQKYNQRNNLNLPSP